MKTILITAYDINPYKGSESLTGWKYVLELARFNQIIAITRRNNQCDIDRYINEFQMDVSNLNFHYYDMPTWAMFWKRGSRGSKLYYYIWQFGVSSWIKKMFPLNCYDIVHGLNFHTDSAPSFLWRLNKPFVWGPINHNEYMPYSYMKHYGTPAYLIQMMQWMLKLTIWKYDPFLRKCTSSADTILVGHMDVVARLRIYKNYHVMNQIASDSDRAQKVNVRPPISTFVTVGRFIPIKNYEVLIKAVSLVVVKLKTAVPAMKFKLVMVGDGPYLNKIKKLSSMYQLSNIVEFRGQVPHKKVLEILSTATAQIFPSFEGAGMVIAESLSVGTPVIAMKKYSPPLIEHNKNGILVDCANYDTTIENIANTIVTILLDGSLYKRLHHGARETFHSKYSWGHKSAEINSIYDDILSSKVNNKSIGEIHE